MKKLILTMVLVFAGILGTTDSTQAYYSSPNVLVNGETPNFTNLPSITNNRTLVEFRPIIEALDLNVSWDGATGTIETSGEGPEVNMQVGSRYATVNGETHELDVAPTVVEGRTVIPLRFISEASGYEVEWNQTANTAFIGEMPETSERWKGNYEIDAHPDVRGELNIYNETDTTFDFTANVFYNHVGEISGTAEKDGHVASLINDPNDCEMTLTRIGDQISISQHSEGCLWYHGVGISLENTYVK
ncbi:copper amine oxidase N-terminal domain-containing protein [Salsuginibacillus kocurii]|uniref:copper amine oxidase N-terminal domain-containing protein n=1 Tax=Salsuginibacillus kocurii TaxID=427078 RepID=UPI000375E84A|nr:copper amine oxidase N-terminal domain-containing protein [Salsuginibacillus kocurii]